VSPSPTLQTTKSEPSRRLPTLLVVAAAAALMLVAAYLISLLWLRDAGYTLVVVGAPSGSDVFVDKVPRGITAADGTIRVPNLERGTRIVQVSHAGADDFNAPVRIDSDTCKDDRVCTLPVTLPTPVVAQPAPTQVPPSPQPLPGEIEFTGAMVFVPAGEFTMGSDELDDEKPPHSEPVSAFYLDKFEVTNAQYKKYCDEKKISYPSDPKWAPGYFKERSNSPVVGVTWEDAVNYARWANKRLPTEQEWEKAASWEAGGKKLLWPWGDVADVERAALGNRQSSPSDVGQHPAGESPYHAQDMAGNVNEWVDAFYRPYPGNEKTDPGCDNSKRVARGCSFPCDIEDAKTTRRFCYNARPGREEGWVLGFRCAVSVDSPKLQEHLRTSVR
jgi:formylglycine-generating enzyme required for sulfatase activity